jgi:hypothetical protein
MWFTLGGDASLVVGVVTVRVVTIIENNHRRILALQYQISKEGRQLPATDIGAHVMTKVHSSELVLKHKLAQLDQLEAQREQ